MVQWDSLLSYNTAKVVTIKDARLGLLHYCCMLGVVVYILVFTILIEKRYLITQRPVGSIRVSLMKGSAPLSLQEMEYCWLPNRTTLPNGQQIFPCAYQDQYFVVFPETEATAMFAATRYTFTNQSLSCNLFQSPSCNYQAISSSVNYVADIEHFTLMIDHTFYAPIVDKQGNAKELTGNMLYANGTAMSLNYPPNNVVGQPDYYDVIQLQTLLEAAGISSLDNASPSNASASMRYDGIVLMIFITYSNTGSYDLNKITYSYKPELIKKSEFKSVQPLVTNSTYRQIINRHGIRMIFVQDGLLGKFDFQVTLLTFVSGLGLMTISTVVVDLIAVHLLPQKKTYQDYKYKRTEGYQLSCCGGGNDDEYVPINRQ